MYLLPPDIRSNTIETMRLVVDHPLVPDWTRASCLLTLLHLIGNKELPDLGELPCPLDHVPTRELWHELHPILARLAVLAEANGIDSTPLRANYCARYYTELDEIQTILDRLEVVASIPPVPVVTHTTAAAVKGGVGVGVDHKDVVAALEEMRRKGEPFTSYRDLGRRFGCHVNTIKKAINATPILQGWEARHKPEHAAALKSTSMAAAEYEGVSQTREKDPYKAAVDAEAEETRQAKLDKLVREQNSEMRRDARAPRPSGQSAHVRG